MLGPLAPDRVKVALPAHQRRLVRLEDMIEEHAVAVLLSAATRESLRADPGDMRRIALLELWTPDAGAPAGRVD
jgi:hypothetical protein